MNSELDQQFESKRDNEFERFLDETYIYDVDRAEAERLYWERQERKTEDLGAF